MASLWLSLSPPRTEVPAGYSNKNNNNRKIESARETVSRALSYLSLQPPYDTKTSLRSRE